MSFNHHVLILFGALIDSSIWNRPAAEVKEEVTPDQNHHPAAEAKEEATPDENIQPKEQATPDENIQPTAKVLSSEVKEEVTPNDVIGVECNGSLPNPVLTRILW